MSVLLVWFLSIFSGGSMNLECSVSNLSDVSNYIQVSKRKLLTSEEEIMLGAPSNLNISLLNERDESDPTLFKVLVAFYSIALLIVGSVALFYFKRSKELKRVISELFDSDTSEVAVVQEEVVDEKRYITQEKEDAILSKLTDFEKEKGFLDKGVSLNALASNIGVNHRYLSYVVNKNKKCDFASYVNELRIGYIVDCLKTDSKYAKYKISYLADKCGFASHSRFTVTFKKVTGDSPSNFINKLKRKKEAA